MKYNIYSIRDKKVGFGFPHVDQSDTSAIRGFAYAVNQEGLMNYSPDDFELYRIGVFDTDKGTVVSVDIPELIVSASSVIGD